LELIKIFKIKYYELRQTKRTRPGFGYSTDT